MLTLVIDNSNSHTKFALGDETQLHAWRGILATKDITAKNLEKLIKNQNFDTVCMASVVPWAAIELRSFFKNYPINEVHHQSPLGYHFAGIDSREIGADRLANVAALKQKWGYPAIAVDFGTAVTFSILSDQGSFLGGAIAPGLSGLIQYFSKNTAQLPQIEISEPLSAVGKNTKEALLSGAVHGYRGMIREILRQILSELPYAPKMIATGAGAEFALKGLPEFHAIDPNLTLEGIRWIGMKHF